jgi:hypothetical protein
MGDCTTTRYCSMSSWPTMLSPAYVLGDVRVARLVGTGPVGCRFGHTTSVRIFWMPLSSCTAAKPQPPHPWR